MNKNICIVILCIIISISSVYADIKITEIMYNPTCYSDKYCEWVEIYNENETSLNITGWVFSDNDQNDTLEGFPSFILPGNSYALIVDDDTRIYNEYEIPESTGWIYTGDTTLGNKLGDSDQITIYDEELNVIDAIFYDFDITEGKSYALINGTWQESEPTPGKSNENVDIFLDYSVIKINEFLPNPEGDDDASMPSGEWIEVYNSGEQSLDLLGFKIKDESGKELLFDNTHVKDSTIIQPESFLIVYVNGKYGFLNNEGSEKLILTDFKDKSLDEITYSESKEGLSWSKINDEWRMTPPTLGMKNSDDRPTKSYFKLEQIYDMGSNGVAEWGDVLRLKINVFKGDSTKNVVYVHAQKDNIKISKQTKLDVYEKFSNQTITIPLQLDTNCDGKLKDGRYNIIISGLDAEPETKEIEVRGNDVCKIKETTEKLKDFEYSLEKYSQIATVNEPFESRIVLKNNDEQDINVVLWSYVYRGPKQYSGNETSNMVTLTLPKNEEKKISLENIVPEAEPGEYNYKIKILKEGRKTPYEVKKEILLNNPEDKRENIINAITGAVVYESSQVKAKRAGIFFFAFATSILLIYQIWRKK